MDISFADLKEKEIINVFDGKKLGRILDILFDVSSGAVRGIVVPGERKIFRKNDDIFVPLERIKRIGDDVILVSLPVQNQLENISQFANSYASQRAYFGDFISNQRRFRNTSRYNFRGKNDVVEVGLDDNSIGKSNQTTQGSTHYFGENLGKKSFVRYKRIDNKKYKWLAK